MLQRQDVQARDVHQIFEEDLTKSTVIHTGISSSARPVIPNQEVDTFSESEVQSWQPNVSRSSDFASGACFHGVNSGVGDLVERRTSEQAPNKPHEKIAHNTNLCCKNYAEHGNQTPFATSPSFSSNKLYLAENVDLKA